MCMLHMPPIYCQINEYIIAIDLSLTAEDNLAQSSMISILKFGYTISCSFRGTRIYMS